MMESQLHGKSSFDDVEVEDTHVCTPMSKTGKGHK